MSQTIPPHQGHAPHHWSPVAQYFAPRPGVNRPLLASDGVHVVLPKALLEQLPPQVQQQVAQSLDQIERLFNRSRLPVFKVVPSRWARVDELGEEELREVGVLVELDTDGELVFRYRSTMRQLSAEDLEKPVLVSST